MSVPNLQTLEHGINSLEQKYNGMEEKLDDMQIDLKVIRQALMGDPTDQAKPGLIVRIDRLERSEATRNKLMWALVTAFGGLVAERLKGFF